MKIRLHRIANTDMAEATPKNLRLRKRIFNATQRKRAGQAQSAAIA